MFSRCLSKYKKMPLAVRAALWFTICSFLQQGISFITTPIFTRLMSSDEYGVWTLYSTWSSVITVLVTLNLQGGGFNNAMLKFEKTRKTFLSSMIGLSTFLTVLWGLIFLIFHNAIVLITELPIIYLAIMLCTILLNQYVSLWSQANRYEFNYKPLIIVTVLNSVIAPVVSILFVLFNDNKVLGRMLGNLLVGVVLYGTITIIVVQKGKTLYSKEYWKFALAFNIPLVPHYLSQIILASSDRIMISKMCGESFAAYYGVSYNIATIVNIVLNSICAALTPWIYQKLKSKQYMDIKKVQNSLAMFFASIALFPILVGPEVISIMAPQEYMKALWVIPPVASSVYFMYLYNIYSNIEFFYEQKRIVAIGSVTAAVVNVGLNYYFINWFGFIAAGYTTLFCYVLYTVCHYIFSKRVLRAKKITDSIFSNKVLLLIGSIVLVTTVGSNLLYLHTVVRYTFLLLVLIAFLVKKNVIIDIVKSIRGK